VLPLLTRIDHVGIACRDLNKAMEHYQATFGLKVVSVETNEPRGARSHAGRRRVCAGTGLRPVARAARTDTPVGKFLARRGEGFTTSGTASPTSRALSALGATGIRLLDERPRHGSMGAAIAFLHPADLAAF